MEKKHPFYIRWMVGLKEKCQTGITVQNIFDQNKKIMSKFLPAALMMPVEAILAYFAFHALIFLALMAPVASEIKGVFGRKGLQLTKHFNKMRTEISLAILAVTATIHWFAIPAWLDWSFWLRPAINIRPQLNLVHRCKSEPCLGSSESIKESKSEAAPLKRSYSANFESSYDVGLNLKVKNSVLDKLFDPMDTVTAGLDAISGMKEGYADPTSSLILLTTNSLILGIPPHPALSVDDCPEEEQHMEGLGRLQHGQSRVGTFSERLLTPPQVDRSVKIGIPTAINSAASVGDCVLNTANAVEAPLFTVSRTDVTYLTYFCAALMVVAALAYAISICLKERRRCLRRNVENNGGNEIDLVELGDRHPREEGIHDDQLDDYLNTAASDVPSGRDELDDYLNMNTDDALTGHERPHLTEYLNTATADVLTGREEMDEYLNTAASEVATARGQGDVLTDKVSELGLEEEHDLMTGISLGGSKAYIPKLEVKNIYTPAPTALSQSNAAKKLLTNLWHTPYIRWK
ncbi:unnamed protein product [Bursaphelenchus okinawaensis]|uniref:Uncharacterized protein n=1 Tax=Bursaphelenchus okinawaensis TaxID=465554 RepID=A0A811KBZ7_9BILA|nr:unnamed protein product [Bursaphelenchus okinawaensis]CAG9097498.1 unnamed protein product [Bursaphelenchus okinawaensis]